jgi:hypothetical protein
MVSLPSQIASTARPSSTRPFPNGALEPSSCNSSITQSARMSCLRVNGFHVSTRGVGQYPKTDLIPEDTVAASAASAGIC